MLAVLAGVVYFLGVSGAGSGGLTEDIDLLSMTVVCVVHVARCSWRETD